MDDKVAGQVRAFYDIPTENYAWFVEKIDALNKRAKKLQVPGITYVQLGTETRDVQLDPNLPAEKVVYHLIMVSGVAPVIAGWEFIATLEHLPDGTIIRSVPGAVTEHELDYYHNAGPDCDHCHVNVRRNDTYVVRATSDGQLKQVGSSCLKDFLGHQNPLKYARMAEVLGLLNELCLFASGDRMEGYQPYLFDLAHYLSWVRATIRRGGWVSRTKAREDFDSGPSTADAALSEMEYFSKYRPDLAARMGHNVRHDYYVPTADDASDTEAALAWVRSLDEEYIAKQKTDYIHNLTVICKADTVQFRQVGIAASLFAAYWRAVERTLERKAAETSAWQGEVGKLLERDVLVLSSNGGQSDWGVFYTVRMVDDAGNRYTWFASNNSCEQGKRYHIKGTVKKHDAFMNIKSTVLTKCRVREIVQIVAAEGGKPDA